MPRDASSGLKSSGRRRDTTLWPGRVVVVPAAVAGPANAAAELVEAPVHVDPQAAADWAETHAKSKAK